MTTPAEPTAPNPAQPPAAVPPAPVAPTEPAPPAAPVAETTDLPTDFETLEAAFNGQPITVPTASVESVEAAAPAPVVAAPSATPVVAPVTPPAVPAAPAAAPASQETEAARAIALQTTLNNGRQPGQPGYVSLRDSLDMIARQDQPAAPAAPEPPPPSPLAIATEHLTTAQTDVEAIEARISELEIQQEQLGEDQAFYGPKHAEVQKEITKAVRELGDAKLKLVDAQRQAEGAETIELQREQEVRRSVRDAAIRDYPAVADKTTLLGSRVDARIQQMKAPTHPDHQLLSSPNAALHVTQTVAIEVANELAARNGTSFAAELAALRAPAGAAQPVEIPPRLSPPGGGPAPAPPSPMNEQQMLAKAAEDPEFADQLLYGGNRGTFFIG